MYQDMSYIKFNYDEPFRLNELSTEDDYIQYTEFEIDVINKLFN